MQLKTTYVAVWLLVGSALSSAAACGGDDSGGAPPAPSQGGEAGDSAAPLAGSGGSSQGEAGAEPAGGYGGGAGGAVTAGDPLTHLGATTDLPTDPRDGAGKPLPEGYHPLKKRFATVARQDEIYLAGPTFGSQRENVLDDGFGATPFGKLVTPSQPNWFSNPLRTAVAADLDGDGIQEFVAVWYDQVNKKLMAKVTRGPGPKGGAVKDGAPFSLLPGDFPPLVDGTRPHWFQHCVTAANLDDDPAEELVVALNDLYIFDDPEHDWEVLEHVPYQSGMMSVVRGDFDAKIGDTTDELFVMYSKNVQQRYQMYDGLEPMLGDDGQRLLTTLNNPAKNLIEFRYDGVAVAGEFDGDDPAQELAFLGSDCCGLRLMILDDANADFRPFNSFLIEVNYENEAMAAADLDGDGVDELLVANDLYSGFAGLPKSNVIETTDVSQPDIITRIPSGIEAWQVRSGRFTADLARPSSLLAEQFVALDTRGRLKVSARDPLHGNRVDWLDLGAAGDQQGGDVLAVGNIDRDSAVVRYNDEHELLYSDPELLVALAAPPFYADTNQAESSSTSFGQSKGSAVVESSSLGYSVGFTVGYEASDPLGIASSSFTVSVSSEFDSVASSTKTRTESVTYTGGGEDSVVFTVVPFDVYYYTVVSAPDASQVGSTISLNLPRKPQTLLASSSYFDRFVDDSRKSMPLFSTHVVGDPFSYADADERDTLCHGKCYSSTMAHAIGQGSGSTIIETEVGTEQGQGTSFTLTTEVQSESKVAGVIFGASAGFSYGFSVESSTSKTTVFTGELGSLEDLTPEKSYQAGLFAYQRVHPTSLKPVLVVDYWVEK